MFTAKELLLPQEKLVGDYNMEIARWSNGRWVSAPPSLYVVLTDHRLVLQPYGRKRRDPAIIPVSYIIYVRPFEQMPKQGILISLKSGQRIGFFIPPRYRDTILQQIRRVAMPAAGRNRKFDIRVDANNLQRLITYFNEL